MGKNSRKTRLIEAIRSKASSIDCSVNGEDPQPTSGFWMGPEATETPNRKGLRELQLRAKAGYRSFLTPLPRMRGALRWSCCK
jgi:hypothetical protein